MPFLDGYETTSRIRQLLHDNNFSQPIISAVTGHCEQEYVNKAILSGMNQVLSKPVKKDVLENLIRNIGFFVNDRTKSFLEQEIPLTGSEAIIN